MVADERAQTSNERACCKVYVADDVERKTVECENDGEEGEVGRKLEEIW